MRQTAKRTDGQTHTARRHRQRLCIVSRDYKRTSCKLFREWGGLWSGLLRLFPPWLKALTSERRILRVLGRPIFFALNINVCLQLYVGNFVAFNTTIFCILQQMLLTLWIKVLTSATIKRAVRVVHRNNGRLLHQFVFRWAGQDHPACNSYLQGQV